MDAREDYVWPRATSELILLPVTGLECVGDRLLAGEACLEVRAGGRGAERRRGGAVRTKRGAGGVACAGGWGKPLWRGWGPEVSRGRPCPGACGEPAPAGSPATAAGAVPRGFRGTALAAGPEGAAAFLRGWWPTPGSPRVSRVLRAHGGNVPGWPRLGELVTLGKGRIPGSLEKRAEPDSSGPKGGGAAPARTSKQGSDWGRRLESPSSGFTCPRDSQGGALMQLPKATRVHL